MDVQKRGEIEKTLTRLFYLALSKCPVNWLESSFQYRFDELKKLTCIDNIFEVLDEEKYKILKKAGTSVYDYIIEKPFSPFPKIKGEEWSQQKLADLINEILQALRQKYEDGDPKAKEFFSYIRMTDREGNISIDDIKQSNIWRALVFRNDPLDSRKGTNAFIMLSVIWSIKNKLIDGKGTDALSRLAETFLCFSRKVLNIDPDKAFKLLNELLNTNHKHKFSCNRIEPQP